MSLAAFFPTRTWDGSSPSRPNPDGNVLFLNRAPDARDWAQLQAEMISVQRTMPGTDIASVDAYGAYGDGIHDDTIALKAAIASGKHLSFTPGKTYLTSNTLQLLAKQNVYGNQATIKRIPQATTTTPTTLVSGVTFVVTVANPAVLAVGMTISFVVPGALGGNFDRSNHLITDITGSTVTLDSAINISATDPIQVYQTWHTFQTSSDNHIYDLIFDGSKASWTLYRWSNTTEINVVGDRFMAHGCTFFNLPGEGIIVSGIDPRIQNCWFTSVNGNAIHFSGTTHPLVLGVRVKDSNLDTSVGHAYGAIIWSEVITSATVAFCYVDGAICAYGYPLTTNDANLIFIGNYATNCTYGVAANVSSSSEAPGDILIQGNTFAVCTQAVRLVQTQTPATGIPNRIMIVGNSFSANTAHALRLTQVQNVTIGMNTITHAGTSGNYAVHLDDCTNLTFVGNTIEGGDYGINAQSTNSLSSNLTINGNSFKSQGFFAINVLGTQSNVNICGNSIKNLVGANSAYIGISSAGNCDINSNVLELLAGATGITAGGNSNSVKNNNVKGPSGTFRSIRQTGGASTGNTIKGNDCNAIMVISNTAATVLANNHDPALVNSSVVSSLNTGGNTSARLSVIGPGTTTDLQLAARGAVGAVAIESFIQHKDSLLSSAVPTVVLQAAAGSGATSSFSAGSTQVAGKMTINLGTGATAGFLARVTWASSFNHPTISIGNPDDANAATTGVRLDTTSNKARMDIYAIGTPTSSTTFIVKWIQFEDQTG